jgi:hypothetical protein
MLPAAMRQNKKKCITPIPSWLVVTSGFIVLSLGLSACQPAVRPIPRARHSETRWHVVASMPLDALAFLNALSDDPLVGSHYTSEMKSFKSKFSPVEEQAAYRLAEFRDKTLGAHLSGFLCTWFLAGKPETMDDLIHLAENPTVLRQALIDYDQSQVEMNVYFNDSAWKLFQQALPDVKTLLHALQANGFAEYWQGTIQPGLQPDISRIQAEVKQYNLVPQIEALVGFGLPSDEVTVSLLHFVWPYGHHLIGNHFVTIPEDTGVIRSTVHELLHNPFNNTDPSFWKAANALEDHPGIADGFNQRETKYGYNNWPDYVAEDSVRALEQLLEVQLGLGERWNWSEDGSMHSLAATLYARMQQETFPQQGESYQSFLIRMVQENKL